MLLSQVLKTAAVVDGRAPGLLLVPDDPHAYHRFCHVCFAKIMNPPADQIPKDAPVYSSVCAVDFPVLADQFAAAGSRKVDEVHLHHTYIPSHADFRAAAESSGGDKEAAGLALCQGMWRFHVFDRDFADIAQHVSIDPEGLIWLNRNWNRSPASATGFNGTHDRGPFMIETVGNFDAGHDVLEGKQLNAVLTVIASVQLACGLPVGALRFHNEMTDAKSCPGSGVDKGTILGQVSELRATMVHQSTRAERALVRQFQEFMRVDFGAIKDGPLPA